MANEDKTAVRRFYDEVINEHRLDVLGDLLAENFEGFHVARKHHPLDRHEFRDLLDSIVKAFPDYYETVEDWIETDDTVVARYTMRGTHTGASYFGVPATENTIDATGIDIFRVKGGKIVQHWGEVDLLGMAQQLDRIPERF